MEDVTKGKDGLRASDTLVWCQKNERVEKRLRKKMTENID